MAVLMSYGRCFAEYVFRWYLEKDGDKDDVLTLGLSPTEKVPTWYVVGLRSLKAEAVPATVLSESEQRSVLAAHRFVFPTLCA